MKQLKILFRFLIAIFREIAIRIFVVPIGIAYYVLRLKRGERVTVVICNHIGDVVYTLAALEALNKKYAVATLVLEKRWRKLLEAFDIEAEIWYISPFWRWVVFVTNGTEAGQRILYYSSQVKIVNTGDYFTLGYDIPRRLRACTLLDCVHRIALGLDDTYEISAVKKKKIAESKVEELAARHEIKKGKSVILTPVAHSAKRLPVGFFEKLALFLKQAGYEVFTNVSSRRETVIEGTKPLICELKYFGEIAEYCGYLAGVRNGVMDLAALSGCRIIALYNADDPMEAFYDIRRNKKDNESLYQYKLTGMDEYDTKEIVQMLANGRKMRSTEIEGE